METRLSPSMRELRVLAHERGLKYYMHLSKPELFALLQSKYGGGTGAPLLSLMAVATSVTTAGRTPAAPSTAAVDAAKTRNERRDCATVPAASVAGTSTTAKSTTPASSLDAQAAALVTSRAHVLPPTRSSLRLSTQKRTRTATDDTDTDADVRSATAPGSTFKAQKSTKRQRKAAAATTSADALDPIMLCPLGPHTFTFIRTNGSAVVYNIESLVQYILATGDFSEPETRIPFSEADLQQIDRNATAANLKLKSVWAAKTNKHALFDAQKVKRDGILGLERCAGEFVTKMLDVVESDDAEEGEMLLIMSLFPSFADIYAQIRTSDSEYARQCMNHFYAYLRGPKNRPTVDASGLLPVILGFLDDVSQGEQSASAFGFYT